MLTRHNLTIEPGDAVIINTGFGRLRGQDNVRYVRTQPGLEDADGERPAE